MSKQEKAASFNYYEYNEEFVDHIVDIAAHVTPITCIYGSNKDYNEELREWYDMINCLVFV